MINYRLELTDDKNVLDHKNQLIRDGINNFNSKFIGPKAKQYSIYANDDNNNTIGGAIVYAHPNSIYIDALWVDEKYRGLGLGKKLLLTAEKEAIKRNIHQSTIDTFSFQAEEFYLKQGYCRLGVISDYIEGYDRVYLRKMLR